MSDFDEPYKGEHPAPYSRSIIAAIRERAVGPRLLDPFAGTGRIHELREDGLETWGVELEPEWAALSRYTVCASATALPFGSATFDTIATSPAYGNRFADSYKRKPGDTSLRWTYAIALGRELSRGSGAGLQWGPAYRRLHWLVWREARRVLRPGGQLLLNCSDHFRGGQLQKVSAWHVQALEAWGFEQVKWEKIATPRNRMSPRPDLRAEGEDLVTMVRP